jgi:hypothetical protein
MFEETPSREYGTPRARSQMPRKVLSEKDLRAVPSRPGPSVLPGGH